ncbi:MAG TPA: benzoate-CoA ligase family protein [Candidatus Tectomicrobia bacterium]|nr:benzoate-CoA ligase family protein [Candidatus Tectomicrobia bacterium]
MQAPIIQLPDVFNAAHEFVDRHVEAGRADRIALRCEGRTLTYGQVAEMVNRVGNALQALGVDMENRVLLLLYDSPEFAVSFFGAMKIGAVPVPVNTMMRAQDYAYFLNDSRAKVLIAHRPLWDEVAKVRHQLKYLKHVVIVGAPAADQQAFDRWMAAASSGLEPAPTSKDDAAFWLYSSGSTGFPKGAVHLHHDMVYCADLYARPILDIGPDDITFSAAKLFFAYGLGNNLYFPFRVGASAVLYPGRPLPETMFEIITRDKPTIFFGVPTLYAAMLATRDAETRYDLSSLRLCVSAGEALPPDLFKRWQERFGTEILDGIGTTEVLHIFISNQAGRVKPGSSGVVVPGYEAKIVDEEERRVEPGAIGNLLVKGESTCAYYWNQHEKTKQTIKGEWIVTGDKYYQDEEGYYWYAGRADDMLKVGGIWVSPIEVENTLIQHPAVLESAVVGHEDDDHLVKPKAFVALNEGYTASSALIDELKNFVKDKIAPYKYPRWITFLPELPKTATGKIQRFKLREHAATPDV